MRFEGKRALITGASQGIGRHMAVHFGKLGAEVWLAARNLQALTESKRLVEEAGGVGHAVACDLRDSASIEALADAATPIDLLIHNAADVTSKPLATTSLDEIDSLFRTNVVGPLQLTRLLLPGMATRREATIVTISSLAGYKPNPSQTVYSVSKRAVNGMADALRMELRGSGIHVVNVALGSVCVDGAPAAGQTPIETVLARVDAAIARRETEVFMSPMNRALMRLYVAMPWLMR